MCIICKLNVNLLHFSMFSLDYLTLQHMSLAPSHSNPVKLPENCQNNFTSKFKNLLFTQAAVFCLFTGYNPRVRVRDNPNPNPSLHPPSLIPLKKPQSGETLGIILLLAFNLLILIWNLSISIFFLKRI